MRRSGVARLGFDHERRYNRSQRPADPWPVARWKENIMSRVDELKAEIERLPSEEFAEILRWLSSKHWDGWDTEIEADSQAGRLDFLVREAHEAKAKGTLKDL
jgi:hypothetical protein